MTPTLVSEIFLIWIQINKNFFLLISVRPIPINRPINRRKNDRLIGRFLSATRRYNRSPKITWKRAFSRNFWYICPEFWFKMETFMDFYYFHCLTNWIFVNKCSKNQPEAYSKAWKNLPQKLASKHWIFKLIFGPFLTNLLAD